MHDRNLLVESTFDTKIVGIPIEGDWGQKDSYLNSMKKSIQANDGAYDLIDGYAAVIGGAYADGLMMNLHDVSNLRPTSTWWSQLAVNELTVNGKLFGIPGDLSLNLWKNIHVMFFNKTVLENNGLEKPYDTVKNGKWTYDKLTEMAEATYNDSNGDGTMTPDDVYGFLGGRDVIDSLYHGSGSQFITKNENDEFVFTFGTERDVDVISKGIDIVNSSWYFNHHAWKDQSDILYRQIFETGHGLFFWMRLDDVTNMRAGEADFGIIPMPKYDEAQDGYHSFVHMYCANCIIIPKTNRDLDRTGVIIEALSAASVDTLKPAYYDKALKGKGSRDEESSKMLDIIFATRIFDLGYMFNWGSVYTNVGSLAGKKGGDISGYSSTMQKAAKLVPKTIQKTMDKVDEIE